MKRTIRLLDILTSLGLFALASCTNFGQKINIEGTKGEVFYKDGATDSDAYKIGNFLKQDGFFGNTKEASVQVAKQGDNYTVKFVYNKDYYEKNAWIEDFFRKYGARMSKELFEGKKVDIALTDKYFKDFRNIPFDQSAAESPPSSSGSFHEEAVNKSDYIHEAVGDVNFYWKGLSNLETKPIVDYIVQNGSFAGGTAEIYITKEDDRYIIMFPVKPEYRNDENTIAQVKKVSKEIKANVFPNDPYSFQMTDEYLKALRTFDY